MDIKKYLQFNRIFIIIIMKKMYTYFLAQKHIEK